MKYCFSTSAACIGHYERYISFCPRIIFLYKNSCIFSHTNEIIIRKIYKSIFWYMTYV